MIVRTQQTEFEIHEISGQTPLEQVHDDLLEPLAQALARWIRDEGLLSGGCFSNGSGNGKIEAIREITQEQEDQR